MSITVRIIFWGLIGFVPNPEGHKGLTALLVDPGLAQGTGNGDGLCELPPHLSAVYLFEGTCEGACTRPAEEDDSDSRIMGLRSKLNGEPLQLAWLLDHEDLDIVGDETQRMKFRSPFMFFRKPKVAPSSERQAKYFSWVQSMESLTGGTGKVREDCLAGNPGCPLMARFKLQGGEAEACHLVHDEEKSCAPRDGKRDVRIFNYSVAGKTILQRAVADAVQVNLEVEGDSVLLLSRGLPNQEREPAQARLRPENGKLTLVIANFPRESRLNEAGGADHAHAPGEDCSTPHSNILFDLLAKNPSAPAVIRSDSFETRRVSPGACELEAKKLAMLLAGQAHEVPHSASACDGASYP